MPPNIISIPLDIRNKSTNALIKSTSLYIYAISLASKISVTASYSEGSFHADVGQESISNSKREDDWLEVVRQLLFGESNSYLLSSRLLAVQEANSEEYEEEETVVISIKTMDALPITVGSFTLSSQDVDAEEFQEQNNLFNWIELLHEQKVDLKRINGQNEQKLSDIQHDKDLLQTGYDQMKSDYELIIRDLEEKFYYLLIAKKDKIWELTRDRLSPDTVDGLNGDFYETRLDSRKRPRVEEQFDSSIVKAEVKQEPIEVKEESDSYKVKSEASVELHDDNEAKIKTEPTGYTDFEIVESVLKKEKSVKEEEEEESEDEEDNQDENYDSGDENVEVEQVEEEEEKDGDDNSAAADGEDTEDKTKGSSAKDTQEDLEVLKSSDVIKDSFLEGVETDYSSEDEKEIKQEEPKIEEKLVSQPSGVSQTQSHNDIKDNSTDYESSEEEI